MRLLSWRTRYGRMRRIARLHPDMHIGFRLPRRHFEYDISRRALPTFVYVRIVRSVRVKMSRPRAVIAGLVVDGRLRVRDPSRCEKSFRHDCERASCLAGGTRSLARTPAETFAKSCEKLKFRANEGTPLRSVTRPRPEGTRIVPSWIHFRGVAENIAVAEGNKSRDMATRGRVFYDGGTAPLRLHLSPGSDRSV